MGKNSKAKRDKNKKSQKKLSNIMQSKPELKMPSLFEEVMLLQSKLDQLFDPELLTTPKAIDSNITKFCHSISDSTPVYLNIESEEWCRQSCCDLNVKEYIKINGGKMLFGYKIWYNQPNYIEAERHAVWMNDEGELKDITFNSDGENRVLFIADKLEKQSSLEANDHKIRWGKTAEVKSLISKQEQGESMIPTHTMSNEDAWGISITYKDWCDGERMPNQFVLND